MHTSACTHMNIVLERNFHFHIFQGTEFFNLSYIRKWILRIDFPQTLEYLNVTSVVPQV